MNITWMVGLLAGSGFVAADTPLPHEKPTGNYEVVARFDGPMPTGVTVSHKGRMFVCFPRWGDKVEYTVAEVKDGKPFPYPDASINNFERGEAVNRLVSVQSVVADPADRLWLLDTGSIQFGTPLPGGPKLVCVDLKNDKVEKTISFPESVVLPTTYLNDVRFDLRRGKAGVAYITDSSQKGPSGIIVVDLDSGKSWRRLHNHPSVQPDKKFLPFVEAQPLMDWPQGEKPKHMSMSADGIALSHDGKHLYYCPLSSRRLYKVSTDVLLDASKGEEEVGKGVTALGDRGFASDGLESDAQGRLYLTDYEHNAVHRHKSDGMYETLVAAPALLWPDTLSLGTDGYLYFTVNQLHRQKQFHGGKDLRERPYAVVRIKVDAEPVLLKRDK